MIKNLIINFFSRSKGKSEDPQKISKIKHNKDEKKKDKKKKSSIVSPSKDEKIEILEDELYKLYEYFITN
jgi:hypothetical protein